MHERSGRYDKYATFVQHRAAFDAADLLHCKFCFEGAVGLTK